MIQQEDNDARTQIRLHNQGEPIRKRVRRQTARLNNRLIRLCQRHQAGEIDLQGLLSGAAHTIRFEQNRVADCKSLC
jgi:hypothetical protein